jgi:hypothetical protein
MIIKSQQELRSAKAKLDDIYARLDSGSWTFGRHAPVIHEIDEAIKTYEFMTAPKPWEHKQVFLPEDASV